MLKASNVELKIYERRFMRCSCEWCCKYLEEDSRLFNVNGFIICEECYEKYEEDLEEELEDELH